MDSLYKYLTIALTITCIFLGFKYYFLTNDYDELNQKQEELLNSLALDKANIIILEQSIKKQNLKIEQYESESLKLTNTINDLNKQIEKYNSETQDSIELESSNVSSEEAIEWLKEQSSYLSR